MATRSVVASTAEQHDEQEGDHDEVSAHLEQLARIRDQAGDFIRDLIAEGAKSGHVRDDGAPGELASYCQHALGAAGGLPSKAAVRRLVEVTLAGLAT